MFSHQLLLFEAFKRSGVPYGGRNSTRTTHLCLSISKIATGREREREHVRVAVRDSLSCGYFLHIDSRSDF